MGTVSSIEDKAIIATLERVEAGLRSKDLDALARCYSPDVTVFDIGSHYTGLEQLRQFWKSLFPCFPEPIEIQRKNVRIICCAGIAVVTSLTRMDGMKTNHPSGRSWTRTTTCLEKVDNQWLIIHEHASMPVDCAQDRIDYLFDPD